MKTTVKAVFAAAVLALAFGVTSVSASTVTKYISQYNSSDPFDKGGRLNVTISTPEHITALAGGLHLKSGTTDFLAWCLDITHVLKLPSNYTVTDDPFSNTFKLGSKVDAIQKLFDVAYAAVLAKPKDNDVSGAFQLALWEILYDSHPTDVGSGQFKASVPRHSDAISIANGWLAAVASPTKVAEAYNLTFYQANKVSTGWNSYTYSQNLVSVTPIPLPAAGLLLGSGLVVLFVMKQRKKATPQVA